MNKFDLLFGVLSNHCVHCSPLILVFGPADKQPKQTNSNARFGLGSAEDWMHLAL